MRSSIRRTSHAAIFLSALLLFTSSPTSVREASAQDEETRQIYRVYEESRPKAKKTPSRPRPKPVYKKRPATVASKKPPTTVKDPTPAGPKAEAALAGITLWHLRPSKSSDREETRILVQEEEEKDDRTAYTPVRVEADAPLSAGDHVRLTIESPSDGYLYVVDREVYADGTMSDPYLIFPTTRTRGGINTVTAGLLVDIPTQEDRPNYFTLKPGRKDATAELLTIIVSPKPLDVTLTRNFQKLPVELFEKWAAMEVPAERFELEGGAGQAWTPEEKAAGAANASGDSLLDTESPLPQTIYRVNIKPGSPLVVSVPLNYGKN